VGVARGDDGAARRSAFDRILRDMRGADGASDDDREGLLHLVIEGFHEQLELLAPKLARWPPDTRRVPTNRLWVAPG
jgi:hypothetical protein